MVFAEFDFGTGVLDQSGEDGHNDGSDGEGDGASGGVAAGDLVRVRVARTQAAVEGIAGIVKVVGSASARRKTA